MNTVLMTIFLVIIFAEVSYLVMKQPRTVRTKKRMVFVDTSVLMDGRIVFVAESGFVSDTLVVPRSVTRELQFLADHADHDKRARARFGLDVIKQLQDINGLDVMILDDDSITAEGVDERLLALSQKYAGSAICTIDYNLNKVAVVEGLQVLNINELAQQLRMSHLPGEHIMIELVQKGQDSHQAIGYLDDGTMVVVEHAVKNIGQKLEVELIRSLQTAAGRMMFAKRVEQKQPSAPKKQQAEPKARIVGRAPRKKEPAPRQQRNQPSKKRIDHEANLIDLVENQSSTSSRR